MSILKETLEKLTNKGYNAEMEFSDDPTVDDAISIWQKEESGVTPKLHITGDCCCASVVYQTKSDEFLFYELRECPDELVHDVSRAISENQ